MSTLTTFKFDEQLTKTIEELKNSSSATSKSEIVRRAIALLKVVQNGTAQGQRLVLVDKEHKEREIILPD
jgi:Arc/MetJ-type ribon-helix-helix transcriptional regulator